MIYHTCIFVPGGSSGVWRPGGSLGVWYITSNVIDWRASCVIILDIWNDALVFIVGAGTGWPSSIIIGCWGVCVGVGVWSSSTVWSSSITAGDVSACMGCRCGERLLGHCISVCLIFLFLHGLEYHVSAAIPPHHQCLVLIIYLPLHHSRSYSSSSDSIYIEYAAIPQHHNTLYQIIYL